jgi:hypothetical protein
MHGVVLAEELPRALRRYRPDGGEVVAGAPCPQDRRVPHGGIGAPDTRPGINPRRIDAEEALWRFLRPFVMGGQLSSRQRAIAASSRCRARRAGLWRRQRRAWHKRPIWVRWEETPQVRRLTAAMRPRVQSSPRKPSASGPCGRRGGRWARGASVSRDGAPGGGRWRSASTPPPPTRFSHCLTAPSLTAEGLGDLALGPALLFEVPGVEPSGISPVVGCLVHAWE